MRKEKKEILVKDVDYIINNFSSVIIVRFAVLDAADLMSLRERLWVEGAGFKVIKNSLLKIVLSGGSLQKIIDGLSGKIAILYSNDVVSLSKLLSLIMKDDKEIDILNLVCDDVVFESSEVFKYASLPDLTSLQYHLFYMLRYGIATKLLHTLGYSKNELFYCVSNCVDK